MTAPERWGEAPAGSAVETDSIDRETWARIRARSRTLASIEDHGARLYPHFGALALDLYAALFKYNVVLRPAEDALASATLGREVLSAVMESPGYASLRDATLLDEARAGAGVQVLARLSLGLLRDEEIASPYDLARAAELARAEEALRREEEGLAEVDGQAMGEEAQRRLERLSRRVEQRTRDLEPDREEVRSSCTLAESARARIRRLVEALPERMDRAELETEAWGRAVGGDGRLPAAERLELGDRIGESESLRRLALLAGAFREYARRERRRRLPRRSSEAHDVMLGDDWARILPAELVSLRHPLLGRALRHRALEGRMQVYRLEGPDDRGRGPLVVCLDGSGSMSGNRDLWAKAVTLALTDIARREHRACRVISFSDGERSLRTFDLVARGRAPRPVDLAEIVRLAEHFPGGGTSFVPPLRKALEALREAPYRDGDVVFVTDGEADIPAELVEELRADSRRLGFRVYGVWVDVDKGSRAAPAVLARFCDEVTSVRRLTADSVRDLFLKI